MALARIVSTVKGLVLQGLGLWLTPRQTGPGIWGGSSVVELGADRPGNTPTSY